MILANIFLVDRRNKTFRKIAIIIPMFILCLGLDNCKNPEEPERPEPIYEYRYNVEVIYTRITIDYPDNQDLVYFHYFLKDPAYISEFVDYTGMIEMDKIGENMYSCYLPKVFVQTPPYPDKHMVYVSDEKKGGLHRAENISIQGAYEQEIRELDWGTFVYTFLYFKMSKE